MASPKNEGFLTEEQREVLKMAAQGAVVLSSSPRTASKLLAENHMKTAAAGGRYVRRTHSGKLGLEIESREYDGAGGKGTWGKLLDTDADPYLDQNDPNYDSGEEPYQLVGATVDIYRIYSNFF